MENSGQSKPTIRFGVFEVNPRSGEVCKSGTRIRLQDQPFKVLLALLEHPGEVVSREELRQRIWPTESFGDFDHAVNVAVGKLRIALGDSADVPRYVETLHRRGYRFIAKVEPPSPSPNVAATQAPLGKLLLSIIKSPLFYGVVAILALACAAIFYPRHRQPLGEKDSVVLGDFSNSTGDSVFDGSLREGLAIELEQSPFLNLTSEERIRRTLRLMDQPADAKLT